MAATPTPVVISTPRSGLNFVRVCIEVVAGARTPGRTLLIEPEPRKPTAFGRTHDVAGLRGRAGGAWRAFDDKRMRGRTAALLIRDPLELYARQLKVAGNKSTPMLKLYASNINHFCALTEGRRAIFYYEDYVKRPDVMASLITFLGIKGGDGEPISAETFAAEWERLQATGRELYDRNQRAAGGSMSKVDPENLKFHQDTLDPEDVAKVCDFLRTSLTAEGKAVLARYELGLDKQAAAPADASPKSREPRLISILRHARIAP